MASALNSTFLVDSSSVALQRHSLRCQVAQVPLADHKWKIRLPSSSFRQPFCNPSLPPRISIRAWRSPPWTKSRTGSGSRSAASLDSLRGEPGPISDEERDLISPPGPSLHSKLFAIGHKWWKESPVWIKLPLCFYGPIALLLLLTKGPEPIKDLLPFWLLAVPLSVYLVWQTVAIAKKLYVTAKSSVPLSRTALKNASEFQRYAQSGALLENVSQASTDLRQELAVRQERLIKDVKGKQIAATEYVRSGKLVEDVSVEFQRRASEQAGSVYDGVLTTYERVVDWWSPNRRRLQLLFAKLF